MEIVNKLNNLIQCIFMDRITAKNAAKTIYIHVWKNHGFLNFILFDRGRAVASTKTEGYLI